MFFRLSTIFLGCLFFAPTTLFADWFPDEATSGTVRVALNDPERSVRLAQCLADREARTFFKARSFSVMISEETIATVSNIFSPCEGILVDYTGPVTVLVAPTNHSPRSMNLQLSGSPSLGMSCPRFSGHILKLLGPFVHTPPDLDTRA